VAITVNEPVVNQAPTADAGADQSVYVGATVTFAGSGSSDSDGEIANYTWVVMDGTTLVTTLYGAAPIHAFAAAGTYTVTLTVTDDGGLTGTDAMTVTVTVAPAVNDPPVADASASDTSVTVDTEVEFSGAGSSDDVATWTWTITDADGNLVETLNGEDVAFTFDEAGTYTVTLNVTDAEGLYDTDSVTITVTEAEDDTAPEEKSFIEKYGVYLGVLAAVIVVALVAMMLLKKKKGGSTEPSAPSDEPKV
jgi:PKD repeat protein